MLPKIRFKESKYALKSWSKVKLSELCEITSGRSKSNNKGSIPLYGATGLIGYTEKWDFNEHCILVARVGSIGAVNVVNGKFAASDNTFVIRPKEGCDINFLLNLMRRLDWKIISSGTSQKVVAASKLKNCEVFVCDYCQQVDIGRLFSTLDKKIAIVDQCLISLRNIRLSIGRTLFRSQEFDATKSHFPLSELGTLITGSTPKTSEHQNFDGCRLFCTPGDLGNSKYISTTKRTLSDSGASKCKIVPKKAILITCVGSTIGKMGIANTDLFTNQQITSFVANERIDPEYAYYAIEFGFPRLLSSIGKQAVPILSKSNLQKLELFIPNKKEQLRRAEILSLIDKRIELTQNKKEYLLTLKKSLLERMFV